MEVWDKVSVVVRITHPQGESDLTGVKNQVLPEFNL